MKRKITLVCGRTFTVVKFRKNLIKTLQDNDYDVSVIAFDNDYEEEIKKWNVIFYCVEQNNRSINPFEKIKLVNQISVLLDEIKPDRVFTFMLTPNTFGVLAAHKSRINNIYSMVEGAGDVFIYNSLKWKVIRFFTCLLLKKSLKFSNKVFFLNNDDRDEFIERKLVKVKQCEVIPGIGVDTNYFAYKQITNTNTFLMIARMMPTKGVIEYCKMAREVKKIHPEAVFNYIGEEFTLTKKDIQEYIDDGSINYLGYIEDIRPYYENCYLYISTSYYREGMPMVLLEASSIGRPIIATSNIGNKDIVRNNYNGLIVKKHSIEDLTKKVIFALENKEIIEIMGKNAREVAMKEYNKEIVNGKILEIING